MKTPSVIFVLGLLVVILAFFDFPLPHFFDKWLLVLIGALIAFFAYTLLNGKNETQADVNEVSPENEKPIV
tara:strand:- start:3245 stop:3457 length:213 start_codon:yes stop_codon:yes gene_type:complete